VQLQTFRIRLLRRLLLGLIGIVALAVSVNYVKIWRGRSSVLKQAREILPADLLRSAKDIDHIAWESGNKKFRVTAKKLLETRKGKEILEGIAANDFNPDGSERNHISSQTAEYDFDAKQVYFTGDVRLRMGKDVEIGMETLHYNINGQSGYSDGTIKLSSPQASGTAQGARYDGANRKVELLKDLSFLAHRRVPGRDGMGTVNDYRITARQGLYSEHELLLRLEGDARLISADGTLSGNRIDAILMPGAKRLSSLACDGNSVYRSESDSDVRTLQGDRILFDIHQETKALENIHVLGRAGFTLKSADGEQKLNASEIHVKMDPEKNVAQLIQSSQDVHFEFARTGQNLKGQSEWFEAEFAADGVALAAVHIRDHARMQIGGAAGSAEDLKAEDIRFSFQNLEGRSVPRTLQADRSVRWVSPARSAAEPGRSLSASSLTMRYSDKGEALQSGTAQGGVTLASTPKTGAKTAEMRQLQSDRLDFRFFPANNRLQSMNGEGNVRVLYGKPATADSPAEDFRTSSEKINAQFRESDGGAEEVTQSGGFIYLDGTRTAKSGICEFNEASQKLMLTDHPSLSDPDSTTSGDKIEYDRKDKVLVVRGNVRSVMQSAAGQSPGFLTSGADPSSAAIVTADEMQYWTEPVRVRYSGNVSLRSSDSQLQAQSLLITNRGEKMEAQGNVRHYIQRFAMSPPPAGATQVQGREAKPETKANAGDPVEIHCALLQYSKAGNSIHYAGDVSMDSASTKLRTDSLDVFLDPEGKKLERANARGKVVITQPRRELRGTEADYDLVAGVVTVIGIPEAECFDFSKKEKPTRTSAPRLTFYITDDRILAGPMIRR
jgi:LPS export ABC transporter protein LptC